MGRFRPRLIVTGAVFSALALGLSACSAGTNTTSPSTSTSSANKAAGPVNITYLHRLPDSDGMTKVAETVKRWNAENPNIQVTAAKFTGKSSEMTSKLEADVKAGTAPCLAQLAYGEVPEMFTKGLVQDVTAEAEKYKDKFGAGNYSLMTVGGAAVGLPQDAGPLVYYYNEVEFKKLGLEVPKTSEELITTAKKAAASGKYIVNFQPDDIRDWLSAQAAAAGDTWYTAEDNKWVVNTSGEGSKKVADIWQQLLDAKATATYNRWGDEYTAAINNGTLIGAIGAAWEASFMLTDSPTSGQWKVALLPGFGKGHASGPWGGSGVAVIKGCAHPAEAMQFNAWFNTQLDDLASQGLVVAALGDVKTPAAISKAFGGQDVYSVFAEATKAMNPNFPYIPGWSTVASPTSQAAEAAAKGTGKVADILQVAQETSVKALKDAGLPVKE